MYKRTYLAFLGGGGDCIESNEGEEDGGGSLHNLSKSHRGKRQPVGRIDVNCAHDDDEEDDTDLDALAEH
jgi:hypothetical protein